MNEKNIKEIKEEARKHAVKQTKKIKQLQEELKTHGAYKQLVTTILKSKNDPVKIMEGYFPIFQVLL